jgi:hypothetical protein
MVAILTFPVAAEASVGVGIQENPVSLLRPARAGGTYPLPAVQVANTGTQDETITLKVERITHGSGRVVPRAWIQFADTQIQLAAHEETTIALDLVVPASARSGSYQSDVVVIGSPVEPGKATNFRPAAATKLEFRVVPGASRGPLAALPPLLRWTLLVLLLAMLIYAGRRYFNVQIRVTRKKPDDDGADNRDGASPGESNV